MPFGVDRLDIESATEMQAAAQPFFKNCNIFIAAAAVSDYRPVAPYDGKMKKDDDQIELTLKKNPDILAEFGMQKTSAQLAVGFALETQSGLENARKKLASKNLDLIAFNFFDRKTSGFDVNTNILTLIESNGKTTELPQACRMA